MIPLGVPWWVAVLTLLGGAVFIYGAASLLVRLFLWSDRRLADLPTSESRDFERHADEAIGIVEDGPQ